MASFNKEAGAQWPVCIVWFSRPVAHWITPFFYNTGWSANGTTYLRTILTLISLVFIATGVKALVILGGILGLFAIILDFVDGNLARLRNEASYWGKFFDGLVDFIFPSFGLFAAGVGLTLHTGNPWFLFIGALLNLISLLTWMTRERLRSLQDWMIHETGPLTDEEIARARVWVKTEAFLSTTNMNGRTFAYLLLLIPDHGLTFFVALAFLKTLTEPLWLCVHLRVAYATMNRWRKSKHQAEAPAAVGQDV